MTLARPLLVLQRVERTQARRSFIRDAPMRLLFATTDDILILSATLLLEQDGIAAQVLDRHVSVLEGSIGIFPRRVVVAEEDYAAARALMVAAGFGEHCA